MTSGIELTGPAGTPFSSKLVARSSHLKSFSLVSNSCLTATLFSDRFRLSLKRGSLASSEAPRASASFAHWPLLPTARKISLSMHLKVS